jgi:hypothetical protein
MIAMIDATHASVHNIPHGTRKVAGYVTGTADIRWTAADWRSFPNAGHVRIDQRGDPSLHAAVVDCEALAATPRVAAECIQARLAAGHSRGGVYASQDTVPAVAAALKAASVSAAHVDLWLANWNLSKAGATALLGTSMSGLRIQAVQWASPTSNPATRVPGSTLTLREANVDLSVTVNGWHAPPPAPPPPG